MTKEKEKTLYDNVITNLKNNPFVVGLLIIGLIYLAGSQLVKATADNKKSFGEIAKMSKGVPDQTEEIKNELAEVDINKDLNPKPVFTQKKIIKATGKVFDNKTGKPIKNAKVSVKSKISYTDSEGMFKFEFPEDYLNEKVEFVIDGLGYENVSRKIMLPYEDIKISLIKK